MAAAFCKYSWGYLGLASRRTVLPPMALVTPPAPRERTVCSSYIMQILYAFAQPGLHQPTFSKDPDMNFCR